MPPFEQLIRSHAAVYELRMFYPVVSEVTKRMCNADLVSHDRNRTHVHSIRTITKFP